MIDQEAAKLAARLGAIEYFVAEAFRLIYVLTGLPQDKIDRSHEHFRQYLQTMQVPSDDPAISDLAAAELQESHERLLDMIVHAVKGQRRSV